MRCKHCGNEYTHVSLRRHENKCYLNPVNASKIVDFLLTGYHGISNISWINFYKFSRQNKVLSSATLLKNLNIKQWKIALIYIIIKYYEYGFIEDFEPFDLIISKLSPPLFDDYLNSKQKLNRIIGLTEADELTLSTNYGLLVTAVVLQTVKDYRWLKNQNLTHALIDGIDVSLEDCEDFIHDFSPKILKKLEEEYEEYY